MTITNTHLTYDDPDSTVESGPPSAAWFLVPATIFTDTFEDLKNNLVRINYKYYKQTADSAAPKTRVNLRKVLQNRSINLPNFLRQS